MIPYFRKANMSEVTAAGRILNGEKFWYESWVGSSRSAHQNFPSLKILWVTTTCDVFAFLQSCFIVITRGHVRCHDMSLRGGTALFYMSFMGTRLIYRCRRTRHSLRGPQFRSITCVVLKKDRIRKSNDAVRLISLSCVCGRMWIL